jgi:hypothetical protein
MTTDAGMTTGAGMTTDAGMTTKVGMTTDDGSRNDDERVLLNALPHNPHDMPHTLQPRVVLAHQQHDPA